MFRIVAWSETAREWFTIHTEADRATCLKWVKKHRNVNWAYCIKSPEGQTFRSW